MCMFLYLIITILDIFVGGKMSRFLNCPKRWRSWNYVLTPNSYKKIYNSCKRAVVPPHAQLPSTFCWPNLGAQGTEVPANASSRVRPALNICTMLLPRHFYHMVPISEDHPAFAPTNGYQMLIGSVTMISPVETFSLRLEKCTGFHHSTSSKPLTESS